MFSPTPSPTAHPLTRRQMLQAGTLGLLGLSMAQVESLRCQAAGAPAKPRSVIYIFLTGGPSQHDTFDMKPDGPSEYKGEFSPIQTRTPGTWICEHLPMLAERSPHWSLVRSLTHKESGHDKGTYVMLTGNTVVPANFQANQPKGTDLPS
ncbi:MAG: DUF1501 domain-containing protein, partial [Pirellulaceae bacterium]